MVGLMRSIRWLVTCGCGIALIVAVGLGGCASAEKRHDAARHHDAARASGALCKCVLLIPLRYNDGSAVSPDVLAGIQERLFTLYGGYTVAGRVNGAARMADGSRAEDESLEIWVAVPRQRVDELRREVGGFCLELCQESMYFEVTDGAVEFIGPAARRAE